MTGHPYIPNSNPADRERMLAAIGVRDEEELYGAIPERLRFRGELAVPNGIRGELELRSHVEGLLNRNQHAGERLSFLGGGCARHFIPAVCEEIGSRGEFLTGYHNGNSMLGSYQTQFEFQTMLGALVGLDMVSTTTYDWGTAVASSLMIAARVTGRSHVIVPASMSPIRRRQLETIAGSALAIGVLPWDPGVGLRVDELEDRISEETAAVYVEVPSFFGSIEPRLREIAGIAHAKGALLVVGVDPISLGVLAAPADYGADIVCGDIQPLGIHMYLGGGLAGFIATRHEEAFIRECPTLLVSILETASPDAFAYGWWNFERTSYAYRGDSHDFAGTTQTIWAIVAATYLAAVGPTGLREIGEAIIARSTYAIERISEIPGVTVLGSGEAAHFKEFIVNVDASGKTIADVLAATRSMGIDAGIDVSGSFTNIGESALTCVTEVHSREDIDRLVAALTEATR